MPSADTWRPTTPGYLTVDAGRGARAYVQHSVVCSNGNAEGTPNAVVEGSASGLPVISTRHKGIVDAVVDGETGLLVDEHDVQGMADAMVRLVDSPELAATLDPRAYAGTIRAFRQETLDEMATHIAAARASIT